MFKHQFPVVTTEKVDAEGAGDLSASTRSFLKADCRVSSSRSFAPASMAEGGRSAQQPS